MKFIKISLYAILYLILCLIVMPFIVIFLINLTGFNNLSNMFSVFIRIILAIQISKQINKVTQTFPNYLKKKNFTISNTVVAQAICYIIYFVLIFLLAQSLRILGLENSIIGLIAVTLLKLFITYIIANIVRYIVYIRKS